MKTPILLACLTLVSILIQSCSVSQPNGFTNTPIANTSSPQDYQYLLNKYVTHNGVQYDDWVNNSADVSTLKNVTTYYANHSAPTDKKEALAWYLNAYNAWTLQKIFDHWPNEGPLDASLLLSLIHI